MVPVDFCTRGDDDVGAYVRFFESNQVGLVTHKMSLTPMIWWAFHESTTTLNARTLRAISSVGTGYSPEPSIQLDGLVPGRRV
jgi:hypothetical protein